MLFCPQIIEVPINERGTARVAGRRMLCDGRFPQMWDFQAPFGIQTSVRNAKLCCRARCNALTQQQRLLLT